MHKVEKEVLVSKSVFPIMLIAPRSSSRKINTVSKMRREKYFKVKNSIESVMPQVTTTTTKNLLQAYRNN